ncbi:hypothetical protein L596_009305 [Steinernema carpocapsae]|uniref:UBX domain-containing protein n=1 Tax=Steinernema carpocapsae TaxID=34508 RepID=A0A4U5PEY6_STECR|nr:hypothetical protein L596_009305 [Steinernema carpocapsae]
MSDYSDYESCGEENYDLDYESDYGCEMEVEVPFKKNLSLAEEIPFILEGADSQVEVAEHFEASEEAFGAVSPQRERQSEAPLANSNDKIRGRSAQAPVCSVGMGRFRGKQGEAGTAYGGSGYAEDLPRDQRPGLSQFPILVVVVAPKFVHQIVDKIDGHMSVDEAKSVLLNRLNSAVDAKNASSGVVFDAERAALFEEQRIAYEKMLAEDKAKREERERLEVMEQQKQEEEKRRIEEETRIKREKVEEAEKKRKSIPEEPSLSEMNLVRVRLRLPKGKIENRRFRAFEKVGYLVTFIESLGFSTESHDIFNSDRPRKRVTDFDQETSFQDVKWPKQEVVFVQEKF